MKCNVSQTDKYVRLVLGSVLFAFGIFSERNFSGVAGQALLWASLFLLLTAAFSWCPITWARERIVSKKDVEMSKDVAEDAPKDAPKDVPPESH